MYREVNLKWGKVIILTSREVLAGGLLSDYQKLS